MLSNPTNNIHPRHRQHRRQNSTPTAFEAVKLANLPNIQPQQQQRASVSSHRRGLSLDTRRSQQQVRLSQRQQSPSSAAVVATAPLRQDFATATTTTSTTSLNNTVGNATTTTTTTTNPTGLPTTPQHHVLRESQQQRTARPGPGQAFANLADGENYLISPQGTPQNQRFDPACFDHRMASAAAAAASISAGQQQPQQQDCLATQYSSSASAYAMEQANHLMMKRNQAGFNANSLAGMPNLNTQDFDKFDLFSPDSSLSTPTFMSFNESPSAAPGWISEGDTSSTRRTSRRISNGIMDRVAKFETLGLDGVQRPITPPNQNVTNYFPPTPMETPHDRVMKHQPAARPNRFSDGYDESMEETVKPIHAKSNRSSGIFDDMRQQVEQQMMSVNTAAAAGGTMPQSNSMAAMGLQSPDFMNMGAMNAEFIKIEHGMPSLDTAVAAALNEDHLARSHHTTPATTPYSTVPGGGGFGNPFDNKPDLHPPEFDSQATVTPWDASGGLIGSAIGDPTNTSSSSPTRGGGGVGGGIGGMAASNPSRRGSPHRRTESLASIASAASISSLVIEDTKTETGVTLDEIAAFIEGPDGADGKWTCKFEDCGKRFGRKENIKSHVQTHLNDRQYQCPTCKKCFVRQHDLKRHAKIHTGVKPYPCECGNSFARHDALTRHRQRGMCIGAFDGIVRKVVKRGRPKKHRPEMDVRLEKSARTRAKNSSSNKTAGAGAGGAGGGGVGTSPSDTTSHSGYSDSSAANSPGNDYDGFLDDQPFTDMMDDVVMSTTSQEDTQQAITSPNDNNNAHINSPGASSATTTTARTMDPSALSIPSTAPMPSLTSHNATTLSPTLSPTLTTTSTSILPASLPLMSPTLPAVVPSTTAAAAASPSALSTHSYASHYSTAAVVVDADPTLLPDPFDISLSSTDEPSLLSEHIPNPSLPLPLHHHDRPATPPTQILHPHSPGAKSVASHYTTTHECNNPSTPPELSASSSPPPSSSVLTASVSAHAHHHRFYDVGGADADAGECGAEAMEGAGAPSTIGREDDDEDMDLFHALSAAAASGGGGAGGGEDGLMGLGGLGVMGGMGGMGGMGMGLGGMGMGMGMGGMPSKFDEEYSGMFADDADVYFGA